MRIQENGQAGTISLNDNAGLGNLDYELQWGANNNSKFRINFIQDPLNPSATQLVLTGTPEGRVGINEDNPDLLNTRFVSSTTNDDYAILGSNSSPSGMAFLARTNMVGYATKLNQNYIGTQIGVLSQSVSTAIGVGERYGGFFVADAASANGYGLWAEAGFNGSGNAYGIYAVAPTVGGPFVSPTSFAGFFDGDIDVLGNIFNTSDRKLKENIEDEANAMDRIMALRPSTYTYRMDGKPGQLNLPKGDQHGFIAQDLEEVFPELVTNATAQIRDGKGSSPIDGGSEDYSFKSVNYIGLIPILTKGIQEQQSTIDRLEAELAEVKELLASNESNKGSNGATLDKANVLYQNTPNPFNAQTRIRYQLAEGSQNAEILVFDMNGRQLRAFSDLKAGDNSLLLEGAELEAGMYFYSLIVNGEEIATKRMILTK